MDIIDIETARKDEIEMGYWGFCSSQFFHDYKQAIDKRLKVLMVEMAKYYEEDLKWDKNVVNEMMFEHYKNFWIQFSPKLKLLQEDVKGILKLPKEFYEDIPKPEILFHDPKIENIQNDIEELENTYEGRTYFLHLLKEKRDTLEKLKSEIAKVQKSKENNKALMKKFEELEESNKVRRERMLEHLEQIDLKTFVLQEKQKKDTCEQDIIDGFPKESDRSLDVDT